MPYYPTIAEDLARAKAILAEGHPSSEGLPEGVTATGGTIFGKDIYAAYKLLESFVEEIDRLNTQVRDLDAKLQAEYEDQAGVDI